MLLAIDVGNTNIMIGVFDREDKVMVCWRIATRRDSTEDELGMMLKELLQHSGLNLQDISSVVISSVVPPLMYSLERMAKKYFKVNPLIVNLKINTGLKILIDNPREVGGGPYR